MDTWTEARQWRRSFPSGGDCSRWQLLLFHSRMPTRGLADKGTSIRTFMNRLRRSAEQCRHIARELMNAYAVVCMLIRQLCMCRGGRKWILRTARISLTLTSRWRSDRGAPCLSRSGTRRRWRRGTLSRQSEAWKSRLYHSPGPAASREGDMIGGCSSAASRCRRARRRRELPELCRRPVKPHRSVGGTENADGWRGGDA